MGPWKGGEGDQESLPPKNVALEKQKPRCYTPDARRLRREGLGKLREPRARVNTFQLPWLSTIHWAKEKVTASLLSGWKKKE